MPRLQGLYEKLTAEGLEIVALEATHDTDRATSFIAKKGLTFTLLEDREEDGVVFNLFEVHSFPTSYVIDREGRVMYYNLGFEDGDEAELERQIRTLL